MPMSPSRCARLTRQGPRPNRRVPKRKKRPHPRARPLLKMRPKAPATKRTGTRPPATSLDLGFLELDVLAHFRVVFAEGHLLGDVPRILLGHVEEAGVGGADELDLDRGRLGHDGPLLNLEKRKRRNRRPVCRAPLP